ncbi:hypothetical protein L7F22_060720 [Adiantum nelumboides]|nr:hypothetical protein [Adiantum nelumboides]
MKILLFGKDFFLERVTESDKGKEGVERKAIPDSARSISKALLCALLPSLFLRIDAMFPDKKFASEARKKCLEFMLAAFQRSPELISIVKKPIIDKIGQPYSSPAKAELALQLCWAVGEHGGGGLSHKAAARELFECLELLLYENLSSRNARRVVLSDGNALERASQARLLSVVVTAITKLATCHRELGPRAHVCLAKVARSHQVLDKVVWRRARDYLGLMHEPAICSSILGSSSGNNERPGTIRWADANLKAVTHVPFYLLQDKEGPPFHDFTLSDLMGLA